jgi:hypothetical protein
MHVWQETSSPLCARMALRYVDDRIWAWSNDPPPVRPSLLLVACLKRFGAVPCS